MDGKESLFEELFKKSSLKKSCFLKIFRKYLLGRSLPNGWKRIFIWRTFKKIYFSDFIVSDDKYKEMKKSSYCFLIFQMDGKQSLFEELFLKSSSNKVFKPCGLNLVHQRLFIYLSVIY